jgi:hypothetical protein
MGRYSSIAVTAITVLALTGCSSSEQASTPTTTPTPTPTLSSTPATSSQAFNNPVIPAKPQATGVVATVATPNLIQSTNAIQRAGDVAKGRTDPFGQIIASSPLVVPSAVGIVPRRPVPALPPIVRATTVSVRPRIRSAVISSRVQVPFVRTSRIPKTAIAIAKLPKPIAGRSFTPVLPRVMPQVVPNPTLVSVLPPTPKPELAQAVAVTGVVMVGRDPQAIIKVPTEPTSRYVQAGDRLSSGLLVKRIEMNEGSEPVVIFEQFGIEVARMVGEGAAAPTTVSSGAVPPPPPNIPTGAS